MEDGTMQKPPPPTRLKTSGVFSKNENGSLIFSREGEKRTC